MLPKGELVGRTRLKAAANRSFLLLGRTQVASLAPVSRRSTPTASVRRQWTIFPPARQVRLLAVSSVAQPMSPSSETRFMSCLAGAGCSHGVPQVPEMPNGVLRVNGDGTTELIANLSAFVMANPVAHPNPGDFEPDGTWYSMIAVGGDLYAVEPNHGELDRITPEGQISRVTDISASQGHIVPTAVAYRGNFYVGNLNPFPVVPGSSKIYKITPSGQISVFAEGLTTVLGVVFDRRDRMYVLETSTAAGNPTPFTGKVIRVDPSRRQTEIASGLFFPTGMTFGPDGALYVSNVGFGPPPVGLGEILRITVP